MTNKMVEKILAADCCEFCGFCACGPTKRGIRREEVATTVQHKQPEAVTVVRTIHTAREVMIAAASIEMALRMVA